MPDGKKINLNQATRATLARFPFIGMQRAEAIISYREANGLFKRIEDVDDVPGIGGKISYMIAEHFEISKETIEE